MQGVIYVADYMQRQERLREWQARRQRDVEWIALKEYWRADNDDKQKVKELYGDILESGLQRYKIRYLVY